MELMGVGGAVVLETWGECWFLSGDGTAAQWVR
jgi:hypothetical protein